MVFSQAMLSSRRNSVAISVGLSRFVLRMVFVCVGTTVAGIKGLVIGVSVAECLVLLLQGLAWFHLVRLPHHLITLRRFSAALEKLGIARSRAPDE